MNSKNSILLLDPGFDEHHPENCSLLIRLTADSLSYAIVDEEAGKLIALYDEQECQETDLRLADLLEKDEKLKLAFKETRVSVHTPNTISVPDELYSQHEAEAFTKFFPEQPGRRLYTRPASAFGFTTVYALPPLAERVLDRIPGGSMAYDHLSPLLALVQKQRDEQFIMLDFTAGSFYASFVKGGQLIFQGGFEIANSEEFNYYLLLLRQQLAVGTNATVYLSGIINDDDANHQCLRKYFDTITFQAAEHGELDLELLLDMPLHYYTSLLALRLCES
ncbi:DUF3822 family protein [Pedobacter faecalis]|uniref:DUF3822 family protein n=1 Tax=Pedobacter faecalis TaxID=3041495 RepID=UPI00254D1BC2|nr:DUF3822 family protein [Pedobacter sp. ELA7]